MPVLNMYPNPVSGTNLKNYHQYATKNESEVRLLAPISGKFELETNINVQWSVCCVQNVDVIAESLGGYKEYSNLSASLNAKTIQLNAVDGFVANENVSITVKDSSGTDQDSYSTTTIATISITSIPSQTAGVAFNVAGSSNGSEVEVFYRVASPEGSWTSAGTASVSGGTYTKSITIASAETYDIKVEDTTDSDGYAQQDDIVVASASSKIQLTSENCDFDPRGSYDAGTGKIAVLGYVSGMSGTPKVGGVTINNTYSASQVGALVVVDLSDGSVDDLVEIDTGSSANFATGSRGQNVIVGNSTHLYAIYYEVGTKFRVLRYALSDGAVIKSDLVSTANVYAYHCDIAIDANRLYCTCALTNEQTFAVRTLSLDMSTLGTQVNYGSGSNELARRGTIGIVTSSHYKVGYTQRAPSPDKVYNYRSNADQNLTGGTGGLDSITNGANDATLVGHALDGTTEIRSIWDTGSATPVKTTNGTNNNTNDVGVLKLANSNLFVLNYDGGNGVLEPSAVTEITLLGSTLTRTWKVDHSSADVDNLVGIHYNDSKYIMVGMSDADFDGSHSGNAKKTLILAEIDISDGSIK